MANKIVREIIHAKGIDIGIYTKDFENEYISLTDIAKYRNDNDPRFVDRKSTRLNSSHKHRSRMPSSA